MYLIQCEINDKTKKIIRSILASDDYIEIELQYLGLNGILFEIRDTIYICSDNIQKLYKFPTEITTKEIAEQFILFSNFSYEKGLGKRQDVDDDYNTYSPDNLRS